MAPSEIQGDTGKDTGPAVATIKLDFQIDLFIQEEDIYRCVIRRSFNVYFPTNVI